MPRELLFHVIDNHYNSSIDDMKQTTLYLALALGAGVLMTSCGSKTSATIADDTITPGDTIYSSPDITVTTAYAADDSGDVSTLIVRNTATSTDTTLINGVFTGIRVDYPMLKLTLGVDTASYALASLPGEITPMEQFSIPGTLKVEKTEKVVTGDDGAAGYFDVTVYVRRHPKLDVTEFLNTSLQNSFDNLFVEGTVDRITPEMDVNQAVDFLADQFDKGYSELAAENDEILPYTYQAYYYPDYQNENGNLITYFLYNQLFTGGAHGTDNATYVTFDVEGRKALGIEEIFTPSGFETASRLLAEKVAEATGGSITTASLPDEISEYPSYYVNYKGKLYPRPALTRDGVAFVYQPYDISSYAEGMRYFLLPYSELKGCLQPGVTE